MPRRFATLAATAALSLAVSTHGVNAAGRSLRQVHRGQLATLSLATDSHGTCWVQLRYQDGFEQEGAFKSPQLGRISWTFRIPRRAALGVVSWNARCGVLWERSGDWRVVRG